MLFLKLFGIFFFSLTIFADLVRNTLFMGHRIFGIFIRGLRNIPSSRFC